VRAVVQRVSRAVVRIEGEEIASIGSGLLALVAVGVRDSVQDADWMADKVRALRIFPDAEGAMNRSVEDVEGSVLVVSQFTLYGDARRGRRPSFIEAAAPEHAIPLYERFVGGLRNAGLRVEQGRFAAMMDVELVNEGPVTILLDSEKTF
jgi:D-aminoacyl-tRNA deacylase